LSSNNDTQICKYCDNPTVVYNIVHLSKLNNYCFYTACEKCGRKYFVYKDKETGKTVKAIEQHNPIYEMTDEEFMRYMLAKKPDWFGDDLQYLFQVCLEMEE